MTGMSALMDEVRSRAQVGRAFSLLPEDIRHGRFQRLSQLDFPDETAACAYLEQFSSPPYPLRMFCTVATNIVNRLRLRAECAIPLTRQYASLLADDQPAANSIETAPWILCHAGVEKGLHGQDLLCAQDLLVSLCHATGLDASCQLDSVSLAALTA